MFNQTPEFTLTLNYHPYRGSKLNYICFATRGENGIRDDKLWYFTRTRTRSRAYIGVELSAHAPYAHT